MPNKALLEKMNVYLANQQISFVKLHNLHWYVNGKAFFTLHAKFEELYDHTADVIDDVAERMLAIGGKPVASFAKALEIATIKELDDEFISSDAAVEKLVTDIQWWIKDSKELVSLAEEAGDHPTADMFIGYLAEYQKTLWMLKAYLA
ncbi:MAG: Dps family protein [Erysipelotrichaceae bacterium]